MNFVRKILACSILLFAGNLLMAQDTIPTADTARNPRIFISGFGGILSETSGLHGNISDCIGAGGALTLNHYFYLGGYGLTMTSNHFITDLIIPEPYAYGDSMYYYDKKVRTTFSHAGLWVGGIFFPKKRVHLGISSRFGWGSIHLTEGENNSYIYTTNARLEYSTDKVFVVTPQLELDIALTSWLKCNIGVGYRYVSGIDYDRYKEFKFSTPQITIGIFFGGFYSKNEFVETSSETEENNEN
jgi:hypothetical protein